MHQLNLEDKQFLREHLKKQMLTMKKNRENVSLDLLKTKYKKGYTALKLDLTQTARKYAALIAVDGIRIHKDYLDESLSIIQQSIQESGISKQLTDVISHKYDIELFDSLVFSLHEKLLADLEPFYCSHCGLYITTECLENPNVLPEIYCLVNGSVWKEGNWIPLEDYNAQKSSAILSGYHNTAVNEIA